MLDVGPVGRYLLEVGQVEVLVLFVLHGQALVLRSLSQHQQSAHLVDDLPLLFVGFQDFGLVLDGLDDVLLLPPLFELLDEGGYVLDGLFAEVDNIKDSLGDAFNFIEEVGEDGRWAGIANSLLYSLADVNVVKGGEVKVGLDDPFEGLCIDLDGELLELFGKVDDHVEGELPGGAEVE